MPQVATIIFDSSDKELWIKKISEYTHAFNLKLGDSKDEHVLIFLSDNLSLENLEPMHIVLLASLIEFIHQKGYKVKISSEKEEVSDFFYDELKIADYFRQGQQYIEPKDDKILNLWKVESGKALDYSYRVTKYLNRNYFSNYDMSALQNALDEIYANVADHSSCGENSFSYIVYDQKNKKISVAVCDFGLGIAKTLRTFDEKKYKDDSDALRDSLEIGVTARTNVRNRGFGLDNVLHTLSNNDKFRILSNSALLVCLGNKNNIKVRKLDFEFKGTLIYFEMSTDSFPLKDLEEEISIL